MNLRPRSVSPSPVFLPEELVAEVLPFLPVKSLVRLKCVNKSWKSLISDPTFVKRHLSRSERNVDFTIVSSSLGEISFTTFHLLENPPTTTTVTNGHYHQLNDRDNLYMVGSCNGLLCLLGDSHIIAYTYKVACFLSRRTDLHLVGSRQSHRLTHLVIWQMKEFRVEDSWTQILKISYNNLQIYDLFPLLPLCLLEKNDTLLLIDKYQSQMIIYTWRDNRAKAINKCWQFNSKNYVESLVWYC
ncbi:unnamed protein product [Vicia faba]|uniref:F-box domain-containing protein n=1 Tax=Vicia faba TaxID=3906 RepID=A0AAV1APR5_VICFA|nr:unnamed protein product [Vicia faba]